MSADKNRCAMKAILFVDDHEVLARLSCEILEMQGYRAVSAYNAQEALEKFKRENFDMPRFFSSKVGSISCITCFRRSLRITSPFFDMRVMASVTSSHGSHFCAVGSSFAFTRPASVSGRVTSATMGRRPALVIPAAMAVAISASSTLGSMRSGADVTATSSPTPRSHSRRTASCLPPRGRAAKAAPSSHDIVRTLAARNITSLTMDGIPRIPRAHAMDAKQAFLDALSGLRDPEEKREAITKTFYKDVFGALFKRSGARFLLKGTILTDVEETVAGVKRQHNVLTQLGIDPEEAYGYGVIEPLLQLRKDGVRKLAPALGLPAAMYRRMPFPGPALAGPPEREPRGPGDVQVLAQVSRPVLRFRDRTALQLLARFRPRNRSIH